MSFGNVFLLRAVCGIGKLNARDYLLALVSEPRLKFSACYGVSTGVSAALVGDGVTCLGLLS